jgi:hypothetical protein
MLPSSRLRVVGLRERFGGTPWVVRDGGRRKCQPTGPTLRREVPDGMTSNQTAVRAIVRLSEARIQDQNSSHA